MDPFCHLGCSDPLKWLLYIKSFKSRKLDCPPEAHNLSLNPSVGNGTTGRGRLAVAQLAVADWPQPNWP